MDHISQFEKNVEHRIRDLTIIQKQSKSRLYSHDFKVSFLFLGVAVGIVCSNVACLCQK